VDTLDNMRTFLAVVRTGSFSAAARALDTVPSVVTKRIGQLEHRLKADLFVRSTRKLDLTESGVRYHRRFLPLITEIDAALRNEPRARLEGRLRIKCPTTITVNYYGDVLAEFQRVHPGVRMELVLMDRSVNPLEEGFDIAIGALPSSYANVADFPLCVMPRAIIAAPDYLAAKGMPEHPRELAQHDCPYFLATGTNWHFGGPQGAIDVDVPNTFGVNDSYVLLKAVEKGLGITIIARHIARSAIQAGRVVEILPDYPVPDLWIKALVPENRRSNPAVQAVLQALKDASQPTAPWDRVMMADRA
jgi:DNA-binding transcriptional LysR family regulator